MKIFRTVSPSDQNKRRRATQPRQKNMKKEFSGSQFTSSHVTQAIVNVEKPSGGRSPSMVSRRVSKSDKGTKKSHSAKKENHKRRM